MPSSDQCAIGTDGSLLDAQQITWYNDPDDAAPISSAESHVKSGGNAVASSSTKTVTSTNLHAFFAGVPAPAVMVAGSRRSGRVSKPSKRVLDANNAEREELPKRPCVRVTTNKTTQAIDLPDRPADSGNESEGAGDMDVESVDQKAAEAAYLATKAMGDQDRKILFARPKSDRTADVRTIFKRVEDHINAATDELEDGHICTICQDAGIPEKQCFFLGSITTLRNHVAQHPGHVQIYTDRCKKLGIQTNERVYAKTESMENIGMKQGTLDNAVSRRPRVPAFTTQGLLDYIVELVVSDDEAFQLVDKQPFRCLLTYLRPGISEKDIPHCNKLRAEIFLRAKEVENRLKDVFKSLPGKVSFTFDTWTSEAGDPYLSVTGHYISAEKETPHEWELKSEQLAFTHIEGNHSGANLGGILVRTIDRYSIRNKMGWFMADNASNNFSAIKEVEKLISADVPDWDPKEHYVRCMEHSIDLSACHFIKEVAPSSTSKLLKKIKQAFKDADLDETVDLDTLDSHLSGFNFDEPEDSTNDGEDNLWEDKFDQFDVADSIGKALALVKQIRASPQARAFFEKSCTQTEVPYLQLILWVRTRWASLFAFLDRTLKLRKPVTHFAQYADESDEVPKLKNKSYSDFFIRKREWQKLELMHEVLQEPASTKQTFSSSQEPSSFRTIPVLEYLRKIWGNMAEMDKFSEVEGAIRKGLANLDKWYSKVMDTDAYFICLVLDPNVKNAYASDKWDAVAYTEGMSRLETVFDRYYIPTAQPSAPIPSTSAVPESNRQYGYSWMRASVRGRHNAERAGLGPRDELTRYLESPLEEVDNVVAWWGHHTTQYPTLSRMARDYLAIQGSATPSERAFSSGGTTGTAKRNRLTPEAFEALQLLKSGYRKGHLAANKEAHKHAQSLFDLLDTEGSIVEDPKWKGKAREVDFEMLD